MKRAAAIRVAALLAVQLVAFSIGTPATAADKLTPRLRQQLAQLGSAPPVLVWVWFADKGVNDAQKSAPPTALVAPRSLQRRAKVRPPGRLVDATDLPVDEAYVQRVAAVVSQVRQRSKWFNGVSAAATRAELDALQQLPFVRSIDCLTRFRRNGTEVGPEPPSGGPNPSAPRGRRAPQSLDYGDSYGQLQLMNVPALHAQNWTGQGALIGHFDDGYRSLSHQAFASLQVVAAHDFVDHDPDPTTPHGSPAYGGHGLSTLSALAGYAPGQLIGAAFGASYVLARTEASTETPLEEDNWVAAIEWADSIGIDVASTSLGYLTFDPPYPSWTWQDMNGNTTVITRAADMAVARGIVVVNAAGNEGFDATHNTLLAPADGDSVITVGGTWPDGRRYDGSSVGPSTSQPPRTKPDVMAQGANVRVADGSSSSAYAASTGTSFSCPLAAGVAALLLSAHPEATPMQIRDALRLTASRAYAPDNLTGWGIVNATAAMAHLNVAVSPSSWTRTKGLFR